METIPSITAKLKKKTFVKKIIFEMSLWFQKLNLFTWTNDIPDILQMNIRTPCFWSFFFRNIWDYLPFELVFLMFLLLR